jgi:signal transduction histidine kinase
MKRSIRLRFTLIFVGIIIGVIIAINIVNQSLLESYVTSKKKSRLMELRSYIVDYIENGFLMDDKTKIERGCRIANVQVMVFDSSQDGFGNILVSSDFFNVPGSFERLDIYEEGGEIREATIYEDAADYRLYKVPDKWMGNQLECVGSVEDCFFYILSTPLESISESVVLTNRFFTSVGLLAAIIGGVIVFFVTGSLTRPIKQLAHLSEQMANQNFEVRYKGNRKDEIGHLGASMNDMSKTLRMVIEELKAANEQLEKDIKEKELIDERRREFVSNVSHELKTPIALIQGYAEGLKEGISDDPESRDYYCGVIIDESAKMNTIVHRLLNLGEIESGIISLDRVDFNLTELLSNVVQSASMLCGGRKVDIRLDAPEELMVNADQMMIEEIMQNFISNACHHVSEPGEILITASKGEHAYVEVFNTGSHIPEEDLDRIWDKFFKVDRSHSRKYGGSGIGLSIVKAIAEAHGGSCGAVNKNDGVAFWFSL